MPRLTTTGAAEWRIDPEVPFTAIWNPVPVAVEGTVTLIVETPEPVIVVGLN